jgi:tRNA(Ile)-lysidine synthase
MLNIESFKVYWDKQFPDVRLRRSHFLLAVSGGVDSIVLAHLMQAVKANCTIAHVNFQLRGDESLRDEKFVESFAAQYQIPFKVYHSNTDQYAVEHKIGIQQAAREIRYSWFAELMKENSSNMNPKPVVLLTAHHENDNVETILMQLFRGTGIHGLTGIPARRNDELNLARPLLAFSKAEIIDYANANALSYVQDSSNDKDDYTRNFIRNTLLPQMATIFPKVSENIIATSNRIKEAEQIVINTVDAFWKKGLKIKKGILSIPIAYWIKVIGNDTYTYSFIIQYGFTQNQIEEVYKLLNAKKGAYIASNTHQFIKWDDQILIVKKDNLKEYIPIHEDILLEKESTTDNVFKNAKIQTLNGHLQFEYILNDHSFNIETNANFAYLDADKIEWPLLFRTWEMTDYFYPLGMRKKKKLNHFLSSLKLNPADKSQISVLYSGDRLIWVVGHRIDDRFKITNSTLKVLKIIWQ